MTTASEKGLTSHQTQAVDEVETLWQARETAHRWAPATEANCAAVLAWLRRPEPGDVDPIAELAQRRMNQWLATLRDPQ